MDYQIHPDSHYGIELRDGDDIDSYVARARGFSSTAEFREYRSASLERKAELRRARERDNNSADSDDRRRAYEFLRLNK
jgi:hypothetical protein